MIASVFAWIQKHERHLGGLVFFFGFVTDLLAMYLLDASVVFVAFSLYLVMVAGLVFAGFTLAPWRESPVLWKRSVVVVVSLIAQYQLGNLLSWFLIFYAKDASLAASWPFIALLGLVFVANEWFRKYRDRIAFVAVLWFVAAYLYAIYALPLFVHEIGPRVFLASTALAFAGFMIYLGLLWVVNRTRLTQALGRIVLSASVVVGVVSGAYFSGIVPPLPLALKSVGVYHDLTRADGEYILTGSPQRAWWDIRTDTVYFVPGEPLYAFSAVSAPIRFGATIAHRWERYDAAVNKWVLKNRVVYPLAGGRASGYRGYSQITMHEAGKWRVRIETQNGQIIGEKVFTAIATHHIPQTVVERK